MAKKPIVTSKGVSIQHVGDETIIFDPKNEVVHRVSRRDFMRNIGIATGATLLVPLIDSISVPAYAAPEPAGCQGRHVASAVGTGKTKGEAEDNAYTASVSRAEAICRDITCDDGDCVSTGHPYYPLKPSCTKLGENSWKCTLRYAAVCKCLGAQ